MGFTAREGLVLHTVGYKDGDKGVRNIAHRLSLSEMVVPYGDPIDHYRKNAFDEGEYGLGKNAHSLTLVSPLRPRPGCTSTDSDPSPSPSSPLRAPASRGVVFGECSGVSA